MPAETPQNEPGGGCDKQGSPCARCRLRLATVKWL
jgi:hypothetical protein